MITATHFNNENAKRNFSSHIDKPILQKIVVQKPISGVIEFLPCFEVVIYILSPFYAERRLVSFFSHELLYFYLYICIISIKCDFAQTYQAGILLNFH